MATVKFTVRFIDWNGRLLGKPTERTVLKRVIILNALIEGRPTTREFRLSVRGNRIAYYKETASSAARVAAFRIMARNAIGIPPSQDYPIPGPKLLRQYTGGKRKVIQFKEYQGRKIAS